MKKINFKLITILLMSIMIMSCQDNLLETDIEPSNINKPTEADLAIPSTMFSFGQGLYEPYNFPYLWFAYGYHETMGDNLTMPWGNFGGRWVNQTQSITLDNGSVIQPPAGGPQPGEIALRNTRAAGSDNATQYEWASAYDAIGQSNIMLKNADNVQANSDVINAVKAWAMWWKAYSYHKVGLLYEEGLINNEFGVVNNSFVPNTEIIAESNQILADLETLLGTVGSVTDFNNALSSMQLNITGVTLDMSDLLANVNNLKARNLVYSTKVTDMTAADWGRVITWSNAGITSNQDAFIMKSEATYVNNDWLPGQVSGFWYFPSPRLIQDINSGDNRLNDYFDPFVFPNPRGRGIQYGCNYFWKSESPIASSTFDSATMYFSGSYEENQLFLAEAKIRTNDIDGGLTHVDAVRSFQNSGLAAMAGTGLTQDQALEEVRKERRLALIMRSVAFYDARRYGVAAGNRTGAHVLDADGNLNTNATIEYGYLEYWPVPAFESDFNPTTGSQL